MTTATLPLHRFTVGDFYRMAEVGLLDEDARLELLDGHVVEMSPIGSPHAGCVNYLNIRLTPALEERGVVAVQNPVRLDDYSEPQPDLALLRARDDHYQRGHPLPDDAYLIIEVCDSTGLRDRIIKLPLYARSRVAEVWIVDVQNRCVVPRAGKWCVR